MALLERESQLAVLCATLQNLQQGVARVVLVSGEAGIGKTALVDTFTQESCRTTRVLRGACDPLFTPRPLGPFYDIAVQLQPAFAPLLNAGCNWRTAAPVILGWLQQVPPANVLIIEDVHWADAATLDLLTYLGRRIQQTSTMLVLTYRDDELGPQHPLRFVLGDLPPATTTRVVLPPLSAAAVAALAQQADYSGGELYPITGGNPFFVTEVLASGEAGVPATVRDAVLARAARLSPSAQQVLAFVSVVPSAVEPWLLAAALGPPSAVVDECLTLGLLRFEQRGLAFRHELARQVVEDSLSLPRIQELHAQILHALIAHGPERVAVARLVHHAHLADDAAAVLRFAPTAARQASSAGAHREAAQHYATALRYAARMLPAARAQLLEGQAVACYLTGALADAIQARESALTLWRQLADAEREGDTLRWLSRLYWLGGNRGEALCHADAAVRLLEQHPPGRALAMAYSHRAHLHMLADEPEAARQWAARALDLAEHLDAVEILVDTRITIGALADTCSQARRSQLEQAVQLARDQEWHDQVGRGYARLVTLAMNGYDYAQAARDLDAGLAYTTARDLDACSSLLLGWRARLHFDQGRWAAAEADAQTALRLVPGASVLALPAMTVLGHLRARQGDLNDSILDRARDLAMPTGELQQIGPVAVARAEAAWWRGEREQARAEACSGYALARPGSEPRLVSQLAFWVWRSGGPIDLPAQTEQPYGLVMRGEWRAAAAVWERLGCPFEQALALMTGDEAAQRAALTIFTQLGATSVARFVQGQLRAAGVKQIPRGSRPTTRAAPFGLTAREREVLALIRAGLSNGAIGAQLAISPKTVDHHVSAILMKLGAHSRVQAAVIAGARLLSDEAAPK